MSFIDKAKDAISETIDQVGTYVDPAGDFECTNGRGTLKMEFPWANVYPFLVNNRTVVRGMTRPGVSGGSRSWEYLSYGTCQQVPG